MIKTTQESMDFEEHKSTHHSAKKECIAGYTEIPMLETDLVPSLGSETLFPCSLPLLHFSLEDSSVLLYPQA